MFDNIRANCCMVNANCFVLAVYTKISVKFNVIWFFFLSSQWWSEIKLCCHLRSLERPAHLQKVSKVVSGWAEWQTINEYAHTLISDTRFRMIIVSFKGSVVDVCVKALSVTVVKLVTLLISGRRCLAVRTPWNRSHHQLVHHTLWIYVLTKSLCDIVNP